jgi:hypothetical protein
MVADHQGGEHQAAVRSIRSTAGIRVSDDEVDPLESSTDHVVDDFAARADAEHGSPRLQFSGPRADRQMRRGLHCEDYFRRLLGSGMA